MSSPRRGRPPVEHPRAETVRYRVTTDEMTVLTRAAQKAGQSVTDYARDRALAAAKRQK